MGIVGDVRYALRALGKSPVFTMVAMLSLALGIGANTAVYGLVDSVLLNLLPVKNPRDLVQLKEVGHHYGSNTGMNALSYPIYEDFRDQNQVFSGMLCRFQLPISVSDAGRNERAQGELVSGSYFHVLGVRAARGRVFTAEDDRTRSGAPYAVLAYDYWQTRYGGDSGVVGREILREPGVLVVSQPTWGVDAGAAAVIRQALIDLAARGAAVLVISQDLDELLEIADRIAVIFTGRLSAPIESKTADREHLGLLMGGSSAQPRELSHAVGA